LANNGHDGETNPRLGGGRYRWPVKIGYKISLQSFLSSGLGVQVGFYNLWVKKHSTANFAKWECAGFLLVTNPAKAGSAGFIEKDFE
jgi:hypothetical protein